MQEFIKYFDTIKSYDLSKITEHSLRPALNELLISIANELNPKIKVIHEHKREGKFGAPDFKIFENENIIGYVENKRIDEQLDKILKSDQIKKYIELSNNLLLTNYLEWIWIRNGEIQKRETLPKLSESFELSESYKTVKELICNYLSTAPQGISEPKKLAESLAVRAKLLKDFIDEELQRQEQLDEQPKLKGLYHTFKEFVFSDLTISEFADAFAQTLIYGLFLAKLNADTQQVNLYNVTQFIPTSFQLIRELVDFLKELENPDYRETRWIVEEVITVMNTLDLRAIQESLSFSKSKLPESFKLSGSSTHKDPYVYFYEDFLAAYDKNLRKAKGVYYTPSPVVNFIVKSTNEILKTDFGIESGLADEKQVTILDFATGTGTFLIEILQQIFDNLKNSGKKELIIRDHILKNIYGFEYLIAPYTITHLKLSQFLKEHNYELSDKERFQVFLTNTLEPIDKQVRIPLLPALSKESKDAQEVKDKPILVITGNPPYSVSSSNKSNFIDNLMKKYKAGLNEKNIQSLSDDYIKFIRFAHNKIENIGQGVIAVITNNSYLSGSIHRRMRETLYNDFDKIYILNLHGNSLRKEQGENVFDIRVGVSILFLIKNLPKVSNLLEVENQKQIFYYSTQDNEIYKRDEKFDFLSHNDLTTVAWKEIKPQKPDFWFVEKNLSYEEEYNKFWSVTDIFKEYSCGVMFRKDNLLVRNHNSKNSVVQLLEDMNDLYDFEIRKKYNLEETKDWKIKEKSKYFIKNDFENILQVNYRIFNPKFTYFPLDRINKIIPRGDSRHNYMRHFLKKEKNIGLVTTRLLSSEKFEHIFITDKITDKCFISNAGSESNYIFPLYIFQEKNIFEKKIYKVEQLKKDLEILEKECEKRWNIYQKAKNAQEKDLAAQEEYLAIVEQTKQMKDSLTHEIESIQNIDNECVKIPNFTKEFVKYIKEYYNAELTPEQILGYIYAILHCPNYRDKYNEFLKSDYPRIPFVVDLTTFIKLSNLGNELIKAHLLNIEFIESIKHNYPKFDIIGEGNFEIIKIDFIDNKVWINKDQYLEKIAETVWNFKIGSYYPIQKYLKDRKGEKLHLENLNLIEQQITAITFTIEKMKYMDSLTIDIF